MNKVARHSVTLGNKQYHYSLRKVDKEATYFYCKAARISQEFLNEDIPELLHYLPDHIMDAKERTKRQEIIRFRISSEDKRKIEKKALKEGYTSISGYLRDLALKA